MNRPNRLQQALAALSIALAAVLVLAASSPAVAQEQSVSAEVRIILGSDGGTTDSALSSLAARLTRQFPQFDTFRQHGMQRLSLSVGQSRSIALPGGQSATIELVGIQNGEQEIRIAIPGGGTTVRTRGGLFFVGGAPVPGGTLILAITT